MIFVSIFNFFSAEPRKDKTDISCGVSGAGNGTLLPNADQPSQGPLLPPPGGGVNLQTTPKFERPTYLSGSNKISRRVICYHGEHCMYFCLHTYNNFN